MKAITKSSPLLRRTQLLFSALGLLLPAGSLAQDMSDSGGSFVDDGIG